MMRKLPNLSDYNLLKLNKYCMRDLAMWQKSPDRETIGCGRGQRAVGKGLWSDDLAKKAIGTKSHSSRIKMGGISYPQKICN